MYKKYVWEYLHNTRDVKIHFWRRYTRNRSNTFRALWRYSFSLNTFSTVVISFPLPLLLLPPLSSLLPRSNAKLRNSHRHCLVILWNSSRLRNTLRFTRHEVQVLSQKNTWPVRISSISCLDADIHTCCILHPAHYSHTLCLCKRPSWTIIVSRTPATPICEGCTGLWSRETITIIHRCCKHPRQLQG